MATIDQFKAQLIGGGARANQLRVILNTPSGIATGLIAANAQFMIDQRLFLARQLLKSLFNLEGVSCILPVIENLKHGIQHS